MAEYDNQQRSKLSRAIANNRGQVHLRNISKRCSLSPLQKMVAVPHLSSMELKDSYLLSHIDWALKTTGGELMNFDIGAISEIKTNETLHLVQHGKKGSIGGIPAVDVVEIIKSGLGKNYQGSIKVSSCFSDVESETGKNDSLVTIIKEGLKANWPNLDVIGYKGPTITNAYTGLPNGGIVTVDPVFFAPISPTGNLDEIHEGLSKYPWGEDGFQVVRDVPTPNKIGLASVLQIVIERKHGVNSDRISIVTPDIAEKKAKDLGPFYKEFMDVCRQSGFLIT